MEDKEKINFHLKISSQSLRRNILGNRNYTQLDWQKEATALGRICIPQEYMRGYMATCSQKWNYSKQSSIYMSSAIDKDAVVTPEWGVNANEIKQKENEDVSSTGIYITDVTGKTKYNFHGTYQPQLDQFLCIDPQGKMNCPIEFCESDEDNTPLAQSFINMYGRKPYTFGEFVQNIKGVSRYQKGCMFDNEYINYLFKTFISDLKQFSIRRTTGYVVMDKLEIAFITEGGTPESNYKWQDVNDIDWTQTFNFHQYWRPATQKEIDMIDKDSVRVEEQVETTSSTKTRSKANRTKSNTNK